jgi:GT2 family glycosyltransferase
MQAVKPGLTSVITVNFNAGAQLVAAARAVLRSSAEVELFVVDNASTDDSLGELRQACTGEPRLRVMENPRNLGFAAACNQALQHASGEWLLFLNPDCVVRPDTISGMLSVMGGLEEVGMAGCLILNPDGSEQAGCRREAPTPAKALVRALRLGRVAGWLGVRPRLVRDFVRQGDPLPPGPVDVDAISGAFMLVRRTALERVGPLDEGYFLHCEDLDWCERFRRAGWRVLFVPQLSVVHDKGTSSRGRPVRVLWHMHRGMVRYYSKFLRAEYRLPLFALVVGAVWARFVVLAGFALVRGGLARALGR